MISILRVSALPWLFKSAWHHQEVTAVHYVPFWAPACWTIVCLLPRWGNSPPNLGPRFRPHHPAAQQTLFSSSLPLHKALHLYKSPSVQPGPCMWVLNKHLLQYSLKWGARTPLRPAERFRDRLVEINASYLTHVPAGSRKPRGHGARVATVTVPAISAAHIYRVLHPCPAPLILSF